MNMLLRRHHDRSDGEAIHPGEIERTAEEQAAFDAALAGGEPETPDTSAEQSAEEQRQHELHEQEQRDLEAQKAAEDELRRAHEEAQASQPTEADEAKAAFAALERPKGNASREAWLAYVAQDPQKADGYDELDRDGLRALYPAE